MPGGLPGGWMLNFRIDRRIIWEDISDSASDWWRIELKNRFGLTKWDQPVKIEGVYPRFNFWFCMTTILPLAENSLVCVAFYRNRRLPTTPITAVSGGDRFINTFSYPFIIVASVLREWPFGFNFCQFNGSLSYFWPTVSMGIIALTAVNRYFLHCKTSVLSYVLHKEENRQSSLWCQLPLWLV